MKKHLLIYFSILFVLYAHTQNCEYLGPDQYLPCGVTSTTITADFTQCVGGNPTPLETTSYTVESIPFAPQSATGTQVFLGDDQVSAVLPIGFSFCFYGNTYSNFYIGSNGWISFSAGQPATFTSAPIPSTAFSVPKNCVMGPWQDWHPGLGGQIRYETQGVQPCRRLVVSFSTVPFFSCTSTLGTFQIVLYEGTNIIENHITSKPACTQWAGGTAVQGVHNLAGTLAVTVAGRNSTAWTATNEGWRYTPSGAAVTPTITWYEVGNPTPIASNVTSITVTPPAGGAYYTAAYSYSGCFANYLSCVASGTYVQDTVFVQPMMNQTVIFDQSPSYCAGFPIPPLPTISNNGITGTWSPSINNQSTTTYTFTPSAGQCANTYTQTITITPNVTPTFAPQGPFCIGANIPPLPSTSQNGYSGTWSPAINNQTTTTYTFTPNAGLCATATNLTINITPLLTPTFTQLGPYCSGAVVPPLNTTSINGVSGTWSPAMNNQATTTYTFTPNAGQCANQTTMTVVIPQNSTPTFSAVGPYCSGANIPALPNSSLEGFTGSWSPALNNTSTTTYTFTSTPGQCSGNTSLTITINPNITPIFDNVGPYCSGTNINPLPILSVNGFNGSWSPAINNTATTTYTFTPTAGQCATTTTSVITINPLITPTFNQIGPYCAGGIIPPFPSQSTNGYTGSWSPAPNNAQTTTYTFTSNPNQCATNATMTVEIAPITPSVTNLSLCQNSLPYSWNGLNINASGQFQSSLNSSNGCDSIAILNLTLLPTLTSTTNIQICENQIPYNWNGLSLFASGTTTVTLTSTQGCDSLATLNLTVNPLPDVGFTVDISEGCAPVQVVFNPTIINNGSCVWNLGNGTIINNCGPVTGTYNSFGCYDVNLQLTNSFGCTNSLTLNDIVCVNPQPSASFIVYPQTLSNFEPTANFTNTSIGHVSQIWNFGDGSGTSTQANPQHTYPEEEGYYYVTLIVANSHGCVDSTVQLVIVENEIIFYVPNTFTPDGDLFNDVFLPIMAEGFDIYSYNLLIFNRWGEIVFESNNSAVGWDGSFGGEICQDGTYQWQISFKELGKDKRRIIRGHVNLLR